MSTPGNPKNIRHVLEELSSAISALHMRPESIENPTGDFLTDRDRWARHASEHLATAFRALVGIRDDIESQISAIWRKGEYNDEKLMEVLKKL